jgi:hypothetical protein
MLGCVRCQLVMLAEEQGGDEAKERWGKERGTTAGKEGEGDIYGDRSRGVMT